jgi:hypothetical protein
MEPNLPKRMASRPGWTNFLREDRGRRSVASDVNGRGMHEAREISVLDAHGVRVGSRLENDTLVSARVCYA